VRVRECTLTGLLAQVVYLDLLGLAEPAAKATLLNGLKQGRGKPETAPAFPGAPLRAVPERPRFPGGLPSIWNVPHARNPNFAGREDLFADLSRILNAGEAAAVTQAITGLGGIGKTQLATEYAYRYASNYAVVWWMRAEEPATLTADYAALATALELVSPDMSDQAALVPLVGQWLRQQRDWLLVFDNARAPAEVRSYIPPGGAGHTLVTIINAQHRHPFAAHWGEGTTSSSDAQQFPVGGRSAATSGSVPAD